MNRKIEPAVGSGGQRRGEANSINVPHLHSSATGPRRQVTRGDGKAVGHITADGWLVKHVDPDRHRLRAFGGAWATDTTHLDLPVVGFRLHLPNGTILEASKETFLRHCLDWDGGIFGPQKALPERYWTVRTCDREYQLALFEGCP